MKLWQLCEGDKVCEIEKQCFFFVCQFLIRILMIRLGFFSGMKNIIHFVNLGYKYNILIYLDIKPTYISI